MPVKQKFGKLSRREKLPLTPSSSIAKVLARRPFGPGVHGPKAAMARTRTSTFGIQLREKQKARLIFDVRERQLRNYFDAAVAKRGNTGEFFVQLLERRLDNVIHRLGFAKTRQQARQLVSHKFFTVNGKMVNVRSYQVSVGDTIAIKETKKNKPILQELREYAKTAIVPSWLSADPDALRGTVLQVPTGEDLKHPFDTKLIIEFYSR